MYLERQSSSYGLLISFFSIKEIFCFNFSSYESVKDGTCVILFVDFVVTFYKFFQCVYFQDI